MEIHIVCAFVFVQLKWMCTGIKCHKIRIKRDNAICSSYRLVNWKRTCIHSSHSQWNTDWAYARIACLFVCLFNLFRRSFVRSFVPSLIPSSKKQTDFPSVRHNLLSIFSRSSSSNTLYNVQWFWYANVRTSKCKYVCESSFHVIHIKWELNRIENHSTGETKHRGREGRKNAIMDKNNGDGVDLEQLDWNGMKWQMSEHAHRTHTNLVTLQCGKERMCEKRTKLTTAFAQKRARSREAPQFERKLLDMVRWIASKTR